MAADEMNIHIDNDADVWITDRDGDQVLLTEGEAIEVYDHLDDRVEVTRTLKKEDDDGD